MTKRSLPYVPYQVLVIVGFAVWGLLTTLFNAEAARIRGEDPPVGVWIVGGQLIWLYWAALVPVIVALVRRFGPTDGSYLRNVGLHVLFSIVFAAVHMAYIFYAYPIPELIFSTSDHTHRWTQFPTAADLLGFRLPLGMIYYFAIAGIAYAIDLYRDYNRKTVRAAQLEAELRESQLTSLRMQLQPHFLFNSLHTIVALIGDGRNDQAAKATVMLGSLLRHSLDQVETHEITLRDEMDFVQKYIALQKLRFEDALFVDVETDPVTLDAYLPSLILQPLIENSVKHGMAGGGLPLRIRIESSIEAGSLVVTITNNAIEHPVPDRPDQERKLGYSITHRRLGHMYGDEYRFDAGFTASGEYEVRLAIPLTYEPLWR